MFATANRVMRAAPAQRAMMASRKASVRAMSMIKITDGVEFDTIARECERRLKWSADNDKASLANVQKVLDKHTATVKAVAGVKSVQRVVCGGCLDYKVVVALSADKFGDWEKKGFAPEADFLKEVKAIPGVSVVETQTYTLMPVK